LLCFCCFVLMWFFVDLPCCATTQWTFDRCDAAYRRAWVSVSPILHSIANLSHIRIPFGSHFALPRVLPFQEVSPGVSSLLPLKSRASLTPACHRTRALWIAVLRSRPLLMPHDTSPLEFSPQLSHFPPAPASCPKQILRGDHLNHMRFPRHCRDISCLPSEHFR
jgi:hypothetical protein